MGVKCCKVKERQWQKRGGREGREREGRARGIPRQ